MNLALLRRLVAAFAACAALAGPAHATQYSIDLTDMWWNPGESGWGLNLIQQGDTIFGTLFVYGPDQTPRWYVAPELAIQNAPAGSAQFGGKLYATTGPWLGGAFNPANVNVTEVGTATLTFTSATAGLLTYSVNGTPVAKTLTRQTWRTNSPEGRYVPGGITGVATSCQNPSSQGSVYWYGLLTAALSGTAATFRIDFSDGSLNYVCQFAGTWTQQGRLASVTSGNWSCASGTTTLNQGTFTLNHIDVQVQGMTATFSGADQYCQFSGRLGGLRDNAN